MNKKNLGQFFTTNSSYICKNLLNVFPQDAIIIDPFAGNNDLLRLLPNHKTETYDIEPKFDFIIKQDTFLNVPNYENKWIFTNPPFLARNKNTDKSIYNLYNVEDLYEACIKSIIGCEGGILIVPVNFFSSKRNQIRQIFLSKYKVFNLNVFEEQVFDDTSYTICSFSFKKYQNVEQELNIVFFPSMNEKTFNIKSENNYIIGEEYYHITKTKTNVKISRLLLNEEPNSDIFLRAIDTGSINGMISFSLNENHFYGKKTDRTFATIKLSKKLDLEKQKNVVIMSNNILNELRTKYHSMFLSNFRNSTKAYARKRISFDDAYGLLMYSIKTLGYD